MFKVTRFALMGLLIMAAMQVKAQLYTDEYHWIVDPALNAQHGIKKITLKSRLENTQIDIDEQGRKKEERVMDEAGKITLSTTISQYEEGKKVREYCVEGPAKDTFYQYDYHYHSDGRLDVKMGEYVLFGLRDSTWCEYDDSGLLIRKVRRQFLWTGSVQEEEVRLYDDQGRLEEMQYPNNDDLSRITYQYLPENKVVKKTYGKNQDVVETISLILLADAKPVWIGEKHWSDDGFVEALEDPLSLEENCEKIITFTYDQRGFLEEVAKPWASYVLTINYE